MEMRQLTKKELEQRKMLCDRLKDRPRPKIDPMDIGLPACDEGVYTDDRPGVSRK